MVLIVCLDDNNGMMFNNRRQSTDRIVTERIFAYTPEENLIVSDYSIKKYPNCKRFSNLKTSFCENDVCFAETADLAQICLEYADKLIVYRWNRVYPADAYFPVKKLNEEWSLHSCSEFSGHSHDVVREEVYFRA